MSDNHYNEPQQHWLQHYYFIRTAFSVLWVIAVFSAGQFSLIWTVGTAHSLPRLGCNG